LSNFGSTSFSLHFWAGAHATAGNTSEREISRTILHHLSTVNCQLSTVNLSSNTTLSICRLLKSSYFVYILVSFVTATSTTCPSRSEISPPEIHRDQTATATAMVMATAKTAIPTPTPAETTTPVLTTIQPQLFFRSSLSQHLPPSPVMWLATPPWLHLPPLQHWSNLPPMCRPSRKTLQQAASNTSGHHRQAALSHPPRRPLKHHPPARRNQRPLISRPLPVVVLPLWLWLIHRHLPLPLPRLYPPP
jgi:hypothetical protein